MSKIRIKFLSTFRDVVSTNSTELDVPSQITLGELLDLLSKKFGEGLSEHFRKLDYLMIFINNVEYRGLKGLDTQLKNGDNVTIGHILAGG
jgi:molybdopterin converting factor small subunit